MSASAARPGETSIVERVRAALLASGVTMILILVMGAAWTFVSNREVAKASAESTAKLMASQVERLLDSVDLVLGELRRFAESADWSRPETQAEAQALLREYGQTFPLAFRLFVWNADGSLRVGNDTEPTPGLTVAGRSWFENQRERDSLQIGPTVRSRIDGRSVISFSRRLSKPDGSFDGVVSLGMEISDVVAIYRSLNLPPETLIIWADPVQGALLRQPPAPTPPPESATDRDRQTPIRDRLRQGEDNGWISYTSNVDGEPRLAFFQRVYRHDLYILVSVADTVIWRDWLVNAFPYFLIGLLSSAGFIGASIYALRWGHQEDSYRHALSRLNDELERRVVARTASLTEILAERENLLEQKDILIQEVNHRVKNSLQQIASLLHLQLRQLPEGQARSALDDARGRVLSIGRVHEQLYSSDFTGNVALRPYLEVLCGDIRESAGVDSTLDLQVADIELSLARTVPLGLVVNELLTNAFKHGRRAGTPGHVSLGLDLAEGGRLRLSVADDGPGLQGKPDRPGSLGMRLIALFVDQLDGELAVTSPGIGTLFAVTFPREAAR